MADNAEVKTLLEEVSKLGGSIPSTDGISEDHRQALRAAVKALNFALEQPYETLERINFQPFHTSMIRMAVDLGIFEILSSAGSQGLTTQEFIQKTSVDQLLLPRILRSLTAAGLLARVEGNRWVCTPRAKACTIPPLRSGFKFMYDLISPVFQQMPEYMAKSKYQCPTATQGPLQYAWNTTLSGFDFVMEPQWADTLQDLNLFMQGRRQAMPSWLDFYPFKEQILAGFDQENPDSVVVVDVGGGLGHGLIELHEKFPDLSGRLILQDLPKTVQQAGDSKGAFEPLPHSFFEPQPIHGARAYYIRQVLHDWPNKECRVILEQLAKVMKRGYSKILLNEFIVPEDRISDFMNSCDLVMMTMSGGMERTRKQWDELVESAGLRIDRVWTLNQETERILEVVLA